MKQSSLAHSAASPSTRTDPITLPPSSGVTAVAPSVLAPAPRAASYLAKRTRAYAFVLDAQGRPIELGSGRSAKAYLGEERWLESKTDFRREVVIKVLQRGVSAEDELRFQMEKDLLERVQGHPNIVHLYASGECDDAQFLPAYLRDKVEPEFIILERLEMSLEERLKASRGRSTKEDLLALPTVDRLFRVLDYMLPIASAVEYAHLVKNVSHRDIKPANILIALPNEKLRGSTLEVRLADFNIAKVEHEIDVALTKLSGVPGTIFFESPEQATNTIELLVNVEKGSTEVEYFEDFYVHIRQNDTFGIFNSQDRYTIVQADRARKRLVLDRPYREASETNVRGRVQKSVGRPADIYALGALLYYLSSGAYANPKSLHDALHKFIEYEAPTPENTIEAYLAHEYGMIHSLRTPIEDAIAVAPSDRFFSYKHFLDGNGELIDPRVMSIVLRCMIRNKPDSYCQAHELDTAGISCLVGDLSDLYAQHGVHPAARPAHLARSHASRRGPLRDGLLATLSALWARLFGRSRSTRP
jgi:serine/threonine protein kinase